MTKKAIVLLSGGLDSTTTLAIAKKQKFEIYALSFDYEQRHKIELKSARKIAKKFLVKEHKIAKIDLRIFGKSALTDQIEVPKNKGKSNYKNGNIIPITYVPARNTIFLSYALAYAETVDANDIFIGVNAIDYSGYPDCRPEFIDNFEKMANFATAKTGKNKFKINTPLINLSKEEIIKLGNQLGVDYSLTYSCYDPKIIGNKTYSCGLCDSCKIRLDGFKKNKIKDKISYQNLF
jgi:7-cyano-7-deazaguanine synthase